MRVGRLLLGQGQKAGTLAARGPQKKSSNLSENWCYYVFGGAELRLALLRARAPSPKKFHHLCILNSTIHQTFSVF